MRLEETGGEKKENFFPSASLNVHGGNMTGWRRTILFVLALSIINLSEENCADYPRNNTGSVTLVEANNFQRMMECTIETECTNNPTSICSMLECVNSERANVEIKNVSDFCGKHLFTVPLFYFECLVTIASNNIPEACRYVISDKVFRLYSDTFNGQASFHGEGGKDVISLKILLMISLVLNVAMMLALLYFKKRQQRKDCRTSEFCEVNEVLLEAQPEIELKTTASADTEEVTSHFIQPPVCLSVDADSAPMRNSGNETLN
ncbi:uncharacterized protein LOC127355787 isoform X6 [Dicentrarchus labrax]|uniref:uncharacterized protein LOC127355787 isoform X6 n=1 Tax=Dicentrarchus labrax TaxID=13489 RepID=UPI0021F6178A|nr:uncharacterized protein LOC127355787 isoform X6 [Dicentrarchus labrax]